MHYGLMLLRYGDAIDDAAMTGCARRALRAALSSG
jgi:hypothetical protein